MRYQKERYEEWLFIVDQTWMKRMSQESGNGNTMVVILLSLRWWYRLSYS
uniref:Uncharacterized protein n=1 Tax=Rhizophora mucronata TaxID=61149 RepID=A0A2P2NJ19_RHIMU